MYSIVPPVSKLSGHPAWHNRVKLNRDIHFTCILRLLNNACVKHYFKSVHVSNPFWSREYNSAKEICKYPSFSKVGGNYPLDLKIIWSSVVGKQSILFHSEVSNFWQKKYFKLRRSEMKCIRSTNLGYTRIQSRVMFPAFSVVICNARFVYENNMYNSALSWKICYLFFVRITFDLFKIVFLPLYLTFSWTILKVDIILCIQKGVLVYRWRKFHHFLLWRRNAVRSVFDFPKKWYFFLFPFFRETEFYSL